MISENSAHSAASENALFPIIDSTLFVRCAASGGGFEWAYGARNALVVAPSPDPATSATVRSPVPVSIGDLLVTRVSRSGDRGTRMRKGKQTAGCS
jgi:hypothetical protein